jgi:hypothetical protein
MRTCLLLTAALLTTVATARPALADDAPATALTDDDHGPKSPATATAWAVGTTLAGAGLFLAGGALVDHDEDAAGAAMATGLVVGAVGPSAGHLYAGEVGHALLSTTARAAGGVMMVTGVFMADPIDLCFGPADSCPEEEGDDTGWLIAAAGVALVAGTTVYDLVDAPRAARRANRRAAARAVVVPTAVRAADGLAPGMAFAGTF